MKKIKLETAIKIDGVEIHEISLRPPKVRDLLIANKTNSDESTREVNLIANLAEVSVDAIQELDLRDYMKIQNWLNDFLSPQNQKN